MMKRCLVGVLALPAAMAWWDGGHYISGAIARRTLIEQGHSEAVEWIEKILALDPEDYANHSSFLTAPTWMDDIRSTYTGSTQSPPRESVRTWDSNHFMNIPIENDCKGECLIGKDSLTPYLALGLNHIDVPLAGALTHMAPEGGKRHPGNGMVWATQLHLRWLFHLMGDSHMPFHMTGLWHRGLWECPPAVDCTWGWCSQCKEFPERPDAEEGKTYLLRDHHCNGGNYIYVEYDRENWPQGMPIVSSNNLHGFWDSMGGFAQSRANTISDEEKEALASDVMEQYPFGEMSKKYNIWNNNWTLRRDVYPYVFTVSAIGAEEDIDENGNRWYGFMGVDAKQHLCLNQMGQSYCSQNRQIFLSEEYRQFAERASKRLVALAGYRLADALLRVYEGLPPRLLSDIQERYDALDFECEEGSGCTCEVCEECKDSNGATSLMALSAGLLATTALSAAI